MNRDCFRLKIISCLIGKQVCQEIDYYIPIVVIDYQFYNFITFSLFRPNLDNLTDIVHSYH